MFHKRGVLLLSVCLLCLMYTGKVYAQEADYKTTEITVEGFEEGESLYDESRGSYSKAMQDAKVTVSREDGIGAIYIEFDRVPTTWTLTDGEAGQSVQCGTYGFLHEYVDVSSLWEELPNALTLQFPEGIIVSEIYVFSAGEMPSWVQQWNPPCEEADLLLFSTHSDDEQLFFAGMLPYYAIERKMKVQVAYAVQHFEAGGVKNHVRPHEQLDGLWTVGIRNYPVISEFPDLYAESKDREVALQQAIDAFKREGISYEDFGDFFTTCLRRFKPLVVVSHDLNGEYGHGAHVLCAQVLTEAIGYAADETMYPESASQYGTWNVEKVYLHLYEESPIVMDYDTPLESLGGKTPFEVSKEGFNCHKSQHWTWFYKWIYGTDENPVNKATDIATYSPCQFGLYHTTVGADIMGGDFFENVLSREERAEKARLEAEAEAARLAEEEAKRQEEEAKRLEEERLQAEKESEDALEAEKEAKERLEVEEALARIEAQQQKRVLYATIAMVALGIIVVFVVIYYVLHKGKKHK